MTTQVETYIPTSWKFFAKAHEALAQDDLLQASRKGWYSAAYMLRGIARTKGWRHSGFQGFYEVIEFLWAEYEDEEIDDLFSAACALELNFNFYEGWDSRNTVEYHLGRVSKLLRKLENLPA
jgi:hypothetical protein